MKKHVRLLALVALVVSVPVAVWAAVRYNDWGCIAAPASPASGFVRLFCDTSDTQVKLKRSDGTTIKLDTRSNQAGFLEDLGASDVTCGASTAGKMAVNDADALQYCDGAATPTRRTAAFGNDAGAALTGDSATAFFTVGALDVARGGTGAAPGAGDQALVSDSASAATWQTLPSCSGTNDRLTYDTSTNAFACGADAWTVVTRSADKDVSSNTTPANDGVLTFTMTAARAYAFEAWIAYSSPAGGTTPDIKTNFTCVATCTGNYVIEHILDAADAAIPYVVQTSLTTQTTAGTATTARVAKYVGWAYSTTGGAFHFQWSQNTSSANATRVEAGSTLRYRQVQD